MNKIFVKTVAVVLCLSIGSSTAFAEAAVMLSGEPVEYMGGMPGFEAKKTIKGNLRVTTDNISFSVTVQAI